MVDKMELRNNFFSTSFPRVPLFPLWPKGPVETDPETNIFTSENRNIPDGLLASMWIVKTRQPRRYAENPYAAARDHQGHFFEKTKNRF